MAEKHFIEQRKHTTSYLLPYFQQHIPRFPALKILEIGCAEGGFLDVLYEMGIEAAGVELEPHRVDIAKKYNPNLNILTGNITDDKIVAQIGDTFDLIVLRDVIEHVSNRLAAFANIDKLLNPGGYLYITFPPRYSGFAGHQQNGRTLLRYVPYLHLLPNAVIRFLGKMLHESPQLIDSVIANYRDGLSIRAFEQYLKMYRFSPIVKELFLFRPIYKIRFNVSPRKVPNIPLFREFIAFGCEYLLTRK